MAKRGGGPDGDRAPFWLPAMLAFGAFAGKCEIAAMEIHGIAEEEGLQFEDVWAEEMKNMSMLNGGSPFVDILAKCFETEDDDVKFEILKYLAPHALDFQCFNLFADLEYMRYEVGGAPAGGFIESRFPLIMECAKLYGDEDEEAQQAEEELEEVFQDCSAERRSSNIQSLLKSLKRLLSSSELAKRR